MAIDPNQHKLLAHTTAGQTEAGWRGTYGSRTSAEVSRAYIAQANALGIQGTTLEQIRSNALARFAASERPSFENRPLSELLGTLQFRRNAAASAPRSDRDRVADGGSTRRAPAEPTPPGSRPSPSRATPRTTTPRLARLDPAARARSILTTWDSLAGNATARARFASRLLRELSPAQIAELPHRHDLASAIEEAQARRRA